MTVDYTRTIHHDGSARYVKPAGPLHLGDEVTVRLRAAPDAPIERILVRANPDGEQQFTEMQPEAPGPAARWWTATLRMSMPLLSYRFLIFTSDGVWWLNGHGLIRHNPTDAADFRLLADYAAPAWVGDSVFYQIFPDRFANGDPSTDVRDGEYEYWGLPVQARRWGERPQTGRASSAEFYGGDLPGIVQHLDYLQDLGVSALYLNPIFTALSNHRYDVADYENVDPHLGGNEALVSLRQATRAAGIRIMLDIVPNHCGAAHPWFQEALNDPHAPAAEFFTFQRHPSEYACWLGVRGLPKLNYQSQKLRQVMYVAPDSIFRRWLQPPYSIDGWRLDVANMLARQGGSQLGEEVGRGIREAVKSANPQAYILGENFFDATSQLQGDMYDAAMNYSGFAKPLWYWLGGFHVRQHGEPKQVDSERPWPTQAMLDTWQAYRAGIPWALARQQFNLLGSHDTTRILTLVKGDQARNRLAIAVLFTYPGVPSVYYGDEIGIGSDPQDAMRECMRWDRSQWDEDLRRFYQTLIRLRRTSPALIEGGYQTLLAEENVFAYLRDTDRIQLVVVGNRGPETRPAGPLPVAHGGIPDGTELIELFSGRRERVTGGVLPLAALPPGVEIWQAGTA